VPDCGVPLVNGILGHDCLAHAAAVPAPGIIATVVRTEPTIIDRQAEPYLSVPVSVTMETIGPAIPATHGRLLAWMSAHGVEPAGPPFVRYNLIDMERGLEIEIGVPVAPGTAGEAPVMAGVLPAGRYASLTHVGPYEKLYDANAALQAWAAGQGIRFDMAETPDGDRFGSRLEIYLTDPIEEPNPANWRTDVIYRLADQPTGTDTAGSTPAWTPPPAPPRRGPAPGIEYAGFWIRTAAYLIDAVPLFVLGLVLIIPMMASAFDVLRDVPLPPPGTLINSPEYQAYQTRLAQAMTEAMGGFYPIFGLFQLISIAYFVGMWTWRQQTLGMMAFGLRVARDADGQPPGLARSLLRYVGYWLSWIALFIGFIWVAFDSRKQGWHDKIAGTVVVRRTA
jgi:uncharacterized RDD family membrane protein YckC/effector-binding domain-containing protein